MRRRRPTDPTRPAQFKIARCRALLRAIVNFGRKGDNGDRPTDTTRPAKFKIARDVDFWLKRRRRRPTDLTGPTAGKNKTTGYQNKVKASYLEKVKAIDFEQIHGT